MGRKYTILEINQKEIKIVQAKKHKKGVRILQVYHSQLPSEVIDDNLDIQEEALAVFLKDLLKKLSISSKRVIVSLIHNNPLTRTQAFPQVSYKDLEDMIRLYIDETFPVELDDYVLDYSLLESGEKENLLRINVLNKKTVSRLYQAINRAGLIPTILVLQSAGLEQIMKATQKINGVPVPKDESYALLDFGQDYYNFSLFQNGLLTFNRDDLIVSEDTEALAEDILSFYQQQLRVMGERDYNFKRPQHFYLSGKLDQAPLLRSRLEDRLDLPVTLVRDLDSLSIDKAYQRDLLSYLNAAGALLCLPKAFKKRIHHFDFFYQEKKKTEKKVNIQALVGGAIIIGLILGAYQLFLYQKRMEESRARLKKESAQYQKLLDRYEESQVDRLTQERDSLESYQSRLDQTLWQLAQIEEIPLKESLSLLEETPSSIQISTFSLSPSNMVLTVSAPSYQALAGYEASLRAYPFIDQVFIGQVSPPPEEGRLTFTIDLELKRGGLFLEDES